MDIFTGPFSPYTARVAPSVFATVGAVHGATIGLCYGVAMHGFEHPEAKRLAREAMQRNKVGYAMRVWGRSVATSVARNCVTFGVFLGGFYGVHSMLRKMEGSLESWACAAVAGSVSGAAATGIVDAMAGKRGMKLVSSTASAAVMGGVLLGVVFKVAQQHMSPVESGGSIAR